MIVMLKVRVSQNGLKGNVIKYLTLILFIGLAWGQNESDTLILADGSVFSGKYLGIIFAGIKFETSDKIIAKPPVKSIRKLFLLI